MRVDERREQVLARRVDGLGAVGGHERAGRAELGDLAVADQDVVWLVEVAARIEHVRGADQHLRRGAVRGKQLELAHHATAASVGTPTISS